MCFAMNLWHMKRGQLTLLRANHIARASHSRNSTKLKQLNKFMEMDVCCLLRREVMPALFITVSLMLRLTLAFYF